MCVCNCHECSRWNVPPPRFVMRGTFRAKCYRRKLQRYMSKDPACHRKRRVLSLTKLAPSPLTTLNCDSRYSASGALNLSCLRKNGSRIRGKKRNKKCARIEKILVFLSLSLFGKLIRTRSHSLIETETSFTQRVASPATVLYIFHKKRDIFNPLQVVCKIVLHGSNTNPALRSAI